MYIQPPGMHTQPQTCTHNLQAHTHSSQECIYSPLDMHTKPQDIRIQPLACRPCLTYKNKPTCMAHMQKPVEHAQAEGLQPATFRCRYLSTRSGLAIGCCTRCLRLGLTESKNVPLVVLDAGSPRADLLTNSLSHLAGELQFSHLSVGALVLFMGTHPYVLIAVQVSQPWG